MNRNRLCLASVVLAVAILTLPQALAARPTSSAVDPCSGEHWGGREVIVDATSTEVPSNIFVQVDMGRQRPPGHALSRSRL